MALDDMFVTVVNDGLVTDAYVLGTTANQQLAADLLALQTTITAGIAAAEVVLAVSGFDTPDDLLASLAAAQYVAQGHAAQNELAAVVFGS